MNADSRAVDDAAFSRVLLLSAINAQQAASQVAILFVAYEHDLARAISLGRTLAEVQRQWLAITIARNGNDNE